MLKDTKAQILHFFKDKDGHIAIWQSPNIPLYGWLLFKILSLVITQHRLHAGFQQLSTAFIFAWALLEVTKGLSYFRRVLGLVVLAATIIGYFA